MRFQCQAAVGPQVSLGAALVRRLHHRDHDGGLDRADPWNQAQQFPRLVFLGFHQQISAGFLVQGAQNIQLLVVRSARRRTPASLIFASHSARCRGAYTSLPAHGMPQLRYKAFQPIHDPGEIFADGQITPRKLLQRSQAVLSVIDRLDVVHIQLLGQLAGIDPITLTVVSRGILSRIARTSTSVTWGFRQVIQPGCPGSFFEGDAQISAQPVEELHKGAGLGLDDTLHHDLADRVPHGNRNILSVCTSMPIYLTLVIKGCSFLGEV